MLRNRAMMKNKMRTAMNAEGASPVWGFFSSLGGFFDSLSGSMKSLVKSAPAVEPAVKPRRLKLRRRKLSRVRVTTHDWHREDIVGAGPPKKDPYAGGHRG